MINKLSTFYLMFIDICMNLKETRLHCLQYHRQCYNKHPGKKETLTTVTNEINLNTL